MEPNIIMTKHKNIDEEEEVKANSSELFWHSVGLNVGGVLIKTSTHVNT